MVMVKIVKEDAEKVSSFNYLSCGEVIDLPQGWVPQTLYESGDEDRGSTLSFEPCGDTYGVLVGKDWDHSNGSSPWIDRWTVRRLPDGSNPVEYWVAYFDCSSEEELQSLIAGAYRLGLNPLPALRKALKEGGIETWDVVWVPDDVSGYPGPNEVWVTCEGEIEVGDYIPNLKKESSPAPAPGVGEDEIEFLPEE